MTSENIFPQSNVKISWIDPWVDKVVSEKAKVVISYIWWNIWEKLVTRERIKDILEVLSPFRWTRGIIWDYLIEYDISQNDNLIDFVNNTRYRWFNLLLLLYLYWDNLVRDYMILDWVNPSREDIFLWELLWAVKQESDLEINVLLKLEWYIEQIYKNNVPNFKVVLPDSWKTFMEFLLSTYSYYLQFWAWIKWWKLITNIIYDFISHLLYNDKVEVDKEKILILLDNLSIWLNDLNFNKWMYMIKKIVLDYIDEIEKKPLNTKVSEALFAYNSQTQMLLNQ